MSDLWAAKRDAQRRGVEPLAVRMRPRSLDELGGQSHILGPGKLLRRMLQADALTSIILHGPPGTGKTTLAELIASHTKRVFVRENAAQVGVARVRSILEEASKRLELEGVRTILFLDEIHRFSKSQQDVLLADVERGIVTLIGATTDNPLFSVNSALVSRSTLFRLEPLGEEEIIGVLRRAIADPVRGYGQLGLRVDDDALRVWAVKCDGDARRALSALEVAVLSQQRGAPGSSAGAHAISIDAPIAQDSIQQKAPVYDAGGDQHYDHASALIKSVRGSDPDAALYWMAHMLEAGEDPRFIARRLAILASEDVGNADPRGIMIASACFDIIERIGMPEARITLAQTVIYLSLAPKSNASYVAIEEALRDVREGRSVVVPAHIKDGMVRKANTRSTGGAGSASGGGGGGGEQYRYAHTDGVRDEVLGMIGAQEYLGVSREYYRPAGFGWEKQLADALVRAKAARAAQTPQGAAGGGGGNAP
jgi:putative ATPase